MTQAFNVQIPLTSVGLGAVGSIGEMVKTFAPSKVLVVTDTGVVKAGILDAVRLPLQKGGYNFDVYDGCRVEAPVSVIEELGRKIKDGGYDLLIGVGGGSTMDTTKVASIMAATGLSVHDLLGGSVAEKAVSKILVPTTAGTGSEWSHVAVVTDDKTDGQTKVFATPKNFASAVIVDPELTLELPPKITADTGMDALTHAIEAYTSLRANVMSDMFAETAIRLIAGNLPLAYAKGKNTEARYNMSFAASVAMHAVAMSSAGLAHSMNEPLGKKAHISHGMACTLLLPHVMEFNLSAGAAKFARIAELMGESVSGLPLPDAAAKSVAVVKRLAQDLGMPPKLDKGTLSKADIDEMAEDVYVAKGQMLAKTSPRPVSREDIARIFHAVAGE
ncbi:iron-containing alcohol dehydrogenase [Chloroflexota bacterium]